MKKCPTCDKTFNDGMKFCQTDGSVLVTVADAAPVDPYKTVVGSQDEITSAIPVDPFKTMVAPPPPKKEEDEILELPEEPDMLKTMVSSPVKNIEEPPVVVSNQESLEPPPSPFDNSFSSSVENSATTNDKSSAGEISFPTFNEPPKADSNKFSNDYPPTQSSYEDPINTPIPSPFDDSMIGYMAPSKPLPPLKQANPISGENDNPFGNSPYNQPAFKEAEIKAEALNTPYAEQVEQQYAPIEQSNWTPPPAPDSNWQNQQINQNTPFQPPVAGQGQNQALAIVSLVCGILSVLCCFSVITGPTGLITGFMAKKNAEQNPNEFGGRNLALGGIITGGIGTLLFIILFVLQIFFGILGGILGAR